MTETGKELERIAFKTNIRTAAEIGFVLRELPALLCANAGMREALKKNNHAAALLSSMVRSGEDFTPDVEATFQDAMQSAKAALSALPTGEAVTVGGDETEGGAS